MSAVNFDAVAEDPELFAARKGAAARARGLLKRSGKLNQDIDHDIRGSLWAGHAEELPGFEGVYFNPGKDPTNPEFFDVTGNKVAGNANWLKAYNEGGFANRGGGEEDGGPGGGGPGGSGGIGTGGTGILGGIEGLLGEGLAGKFSRYGDDTVQRMRGQAFETGQSRLGQQLQSIKGEAASEGLGGAAVAALRQRARSETAKDYSSATREIANQKAVADYEDRRNALRDAMEYVNSTREYQLGQARNENDRKRIESEAAVARERIANESQMLDRQLAAQQAMQEASARASAAGQNRGQNFQREMAQMRREWDVQDRDFLLPLQLAQLAI